MYSRPCCQLVAASNGVAALLRFVRLTNRSAVHVGVLRQALRIMANLCKHADLVPLVLASDECFSVLCERLQYFRDVEVSCCASNGCFDA